MFEPPFGLIIRWWIRRCQAVKLRSTTGIIIDELGIGYKCWMINHDLQPPGGQRPDARQKII